MITLDKILTELKGESVNEIVAGGRKRKRRKRKNSSVSSKSSKSVSSKSARSS